MKSSLFLSLFTLLLCAGVAAQPTFTPGYIVQPAGDSLRGDIKVNEKKPLEPFNKVTFRDAAGIQKMLKPAKLPAYGYGDQHFIAIKDNDEFSFYKVLAKGHITLLEWKYEGLRMNKPVVETEYFLLVPGQKSLEPVKQKNFRKQLLAHISDNASMAEEMPDEKQFDPEAAAAVIKNYNAWKAGDKQQ